MLAFPPAAAVVSCAAALLPAALADDWRSERYRFVAPLPPGLMDYPEVSLRLRGAFGVALRRLSGEGGAYAALFEPADAAGRPLPRPFVVRGSIAGGALVADLVLFGWAHVWRDEAAAAMLAALQGGIALAAGARQRVPLAVQSLEHRRFGYCEMIAGASYARLKFRSPVALRRRGTVHADPQAVVASAIRRVSDMAYWQDARLICDEAALHDLIAGLAFDIDDWRPYSWARHSRRQGDVPIPMRGWLGSLTLRGPLGDLAPVLAMAETCNIGSHATLGLGWFELTMV